MAFTRLTRLWNCLRRVRRGAAFERDLAEEMRLHREMEQEHAVARGASPEEAARQAAIRFGGATQAMEASREQWQVRWLATFVRDARFALRGFRREPGFAIPVCAVLGVGLGLLAAAFTAFNAGVLRSYGVRGASQLYGVSWYSQQDGNDAVTYAEFADIRRQKDVFEDVVAETERGDWIPESNGTVQVVSGNYFTSLGAPVCLGRPLIEEDDQASGSSVAVVISDAIWKRRYHRNPSIIGARISKRLQVVGVACPSFEGMNEREQNYWAALPYAFRSLYGEGSPAGLHLIARLRPGIPEEDAKRALLRYGQTAFARWRTHKPTGVKLTPRRAMVNWRDAVTEFGVTFTAFGLVLLIACANVSNLLLARALTRRREIGVRLSLGATRERVARQLLTESFMLALLSTPIAYCVAYGTAFGVTWVFSHTKGISMEFQGRWLFARPDWTVFAFLLGAALLAAFAAGLAPALHATRASLNSASSAMARPSRLRSVMVAAQVAVSVVLLISVTTLVRTQIHKIESTGFDSLRTLYVTQLGPEHSAALQKALAATEMAAPPALYDWDWAPNGRVASGSSTVAGVRVNFASPEYFPLMGLRLIKGTVYGAAGSEGQAVVSESAARRLWPGQDAVGRTLLLSEGVRQLGRSGVVVRQAVVIGIVQDNTLEGSTKAARPLTVYFAHTPARAGDTYLGWLVFRPKGSVAEAQQAAAKFLKDVFRSDKVNPASEGELMERGMSGYRLLIGILGWMGALALALTVYGIYSVVAYVASQRRKELGIRLALGAQPADVAGTVLKQALGVAALAIPLAAWGAAGLVRWLASVQRISVVVDAAGLGAGLALVVVATLLAAAVPAFRAARADLLDALRCD